jgi:hypothetical protein
MPRAINLRHSHLSRTDGRLASLIGDHGPTGYGVYWMIIEMLHSEEFADMKCDDKMVKRMSAQVGIGIFRFRQLLGQLIDLYDLLRMEDGRLVPVIVYRLSAGRHRRSRKQMDYIPVAEPPACDSQSFSESDGTPTSNPEPKQAPSRSKGVRAPMLAELNTEYDSDPAGDTPATEASKPEELPVEDLKGDEEVPSLYRRQYQMEELRYYEEIKTYIEVRAPKVAQMPEPLTLDEALDLEATHDQDFLFAVLEDMQKTENLDEYFSAYNAFCIFARHRQCRETEAPPEKG